MQARDHSVYLQIIKCYKAEIYVTTLQMLILFSSKCFRDGFSPVKNYHHAQNVEIWRRNVECHDLTFLGATRDATSHAQTYTRLCLKI